MTVMNEKEPRCSVCGKLASECIPVQVWKDIQKYPSASSMAKDDGTYNPHENVFCCNTCYIKIGMPLGIAHTMYTTQIDK